MSRRVVVTGLGPVTSIGSGRSAFDASLRRGVSGISRLRMPTVQGFAVRMGGEVHDFEPARWLDRIPPEGIGRCAALTLAAAKLAIDDAGLEPAGAWRKRCGLSVGTTDGESQATDELVAVWVRSGVGNVPPAMIRKAAAEGLAAVVAQELGLGGEAMALATACAAGNYAIGNAFDLVAEGEANVALTGGAEAIARKSYAGFHRLGAIAPETCQPFDANRQGMIPAEGAGMLVLESLEHALARGATIHAELLGYGLSCDAKHPTSPDADSIAACIRRSHRHAGVEPRQIDYICAHGTGTRLNDVIESRAIKAVFGDTPPPVSSIKSMLGHTMGAASALGTIATVLAIREGYMPPTINCPTPDPECGIDCVPGTCRPATIRFAQNHGFAFGGNNAVVILGRYPRPIPKGV